MTGARFEVLLTKGAEDDLEEIQYYVATNRSLQIANKLLDDILEKIGSLEEFPERGAIPPEFESLGIQEFKQLILHPYRLIYRIIGNNVYIMIIADGRRDMQTLLEHRLLGGI